MIKLSKSRIKTLRENFKKKKIVVLGDMMLDCYYWGNVKRISPEAPVPVVEVESESFKFGGAANVAFNIETLGGNPIPIGVIGKDNFGYIFSSLLTDAKIDSHALIFDKERPTTAKTRVIAHNQHVVRIDKESTDYISKHNQNKIVEYLAESIDEIDGIILQDYNKGVLTPSLIERVIELANKNNVLITVDPKFNNFFHYKNVTVFKPNRKEAEDVLGMKIRNDEDILIAGEKLLSKLECKYLLLTLGEEGISIFEKGKEVKRMPTKARKVADVSGAGDTVISTLTIALAAGANIVEASYLANYAAGIVCEEVGIVPIDAKILFETVARENQ